MGERKHAKPVSATDDTTVEDWLVQATQWLAENETEQAEFCEKMALEADCTEEEYGWYVIGVVVMFVRLGRLEEAWALFTSDDVPFLQTPRGSLEMSTAFGNALRESSDAEAACEVLVRAEQKTITLFERGLPWRVVARHTLALTQAMEALM